MKKTVFVLLLVILTVGVWGQEIVKQESYKLNEIGEEAFNNLKETFLDTAFNSYKYIYYCILAPYYGDTEYSFWNTEIIVTYYTKGNVDFLFARDQSIECIYTTNDSGWKLNGQEYLRTPTRSQFQDAQQLGQFNEVLGYLAISEFNGWIGNVNRLIRLEQAKALAKIPAEKRTGYWFFIKPLAE